MGHFLKALIIINVGTVDGTVIDKIVEAAAAAKKQYREILVES